MKSVILEDNYDHLALIVENRDETGESIERVAFPMPKERGPLVYTTKGDQPFDSLARTLELSETPSEFSVAVVWRMGDEVVRRDVHLILKQASVVADAIASTF